MSVWPVTSPPFLFVSLHSPPLPPYILSPRLYLSLFLFVIDHIPYLSVVCWSPVKVQPNHCLWSHPTLCPQSSSLPALLPVFRLKFFPCLRRWFFEQINISIRPHSEIWHGIFSVELFSTCWISEFNNKYIEMSVKGVDLLHLSTIDCCQLILGLRLTIFHNFFFAWKIAADCSLTNWLMVLLYVARTC